MWYAVRYNDEWDWDYGSYDKAEAVEMAQATEYKRIAVINEENSFCEEEFDA